MYVCIYIYTHTYIYQLDVLVVYRAWANINLSDISTLYIRLRGYFMSYF